LLAAYLLAVVRRIEYPYELEWMEGAMSAHVARVLGGQRLYVAPTLAFVPFVYPPLYYYACAAVATVTGLDLATLRIVSVLSSIASISLLYSMVTRETKSTLCGLSAAGFFAGTYALSGFWFDVGRVDSMFVALVLAVAYVVRFGRGLPSAALAGVLITMAFFTKQAALFMVIPFAAYLLRAEARRGWAFLATAAALVVAASVAIDTFHAGWFGYYTHRVVQGHRWVWDAVLSFWRTEVLWPCGLAVAVSCFFWVRGSPSSRPHTRTFHALTIGGLLFIAWLSRMHTGGWVNVLIPAHAGLAMGFALGIHASRAQGSDRSAWIGPLIAVLQLVALLYDPRAAIPSAEDRRAGDQVIATLRNTHGEVWLTHHAFLPERAGKTSQAHLMAVLDVMRSSADFHDAKGRLARASNEAIHSKRFALILLDNRDFWFLPALEHDYVQQPFDIYETPDALRPRSGATIRPELAHRPR
jgi:4-amino-4-deoxy-L-arabinose transferase-like glycosyltransferase